MPTSRPWCRHACTSAAPRPTSSTARPGAASGSDDRVLFLGQVDGELENGVDERREVARIIRTVRPTVVLGHDPWRRYRLHPDHRAAGFLTVDALVAARDPHFFPELGLAPHRPEVLLLFEAGPAQPRRGRPRVRRRRKIDALLCHQSQWESTMGIEPAVDRARVAGGPGRNSRHGPGQHRQFAAKVRRQLAEHGALAGLAAAEAFRLISDL